MLKIDADADAGGADEDDDAAVDDDPDAATAAAAASTSIPLIAGGRIGLDSVSLRRRFLFSSSSSSFESDLGMQRVSEIERRSATAVVFVVTIAGRLRIPILGAEPIPPMIQREKIFAAKLAPAMTASLIKNHSSSRMNSLR